jgi:hypothetical protein
MDKGKYGIKEGEKRKKMILFSSEVNRWREVLKKKKTKKKKK